MALLFFAVPSSHVGCDDDAFVEFFYDSSNPAIANAQSIAEHGFANEDASAINDEKEFVRFSLTKIFARSWKLSHDVTSNEVPLAHVITQRPKRVEINTPLIVGDF